MSGLLRAVALAASSASMILPVTSPAMARADLVLAIGGEPDNGYDPLLGWGRHGHPLFQSTLLTRDAELATQPDLATSWTLSDDRLTWTVAIRSDARFSDGTALTAHDVAFTFNEAARAGGAVDLTVFETAAALDDTTVTIRLAHPWITFTENFYSLGIVPAHAYGEDYARNPLGSGPYRLVSWTRGEQLIVERNPYYHGRHSPFSRLTFLFTDEDTSLAAAQAGQADVVAAPAALADVVPPGFTRTVVPSVDNRGITFPMRRADGEMTEGGAPIGNNVTADAAIRRAINMGVDREVLVEVALLGHGSPANGPADGLPWSNPQAAVEYDLAAANALLDDAGWERGSDGVRVKDGTRAAFPINYPASDSTRQALAITLAEQLRSLGIEATATGTSWNVIERVMHSEPAMFGWGSHSPLEVFSLYDSSWGGVEYFNVGFFSNATVDAHLDAAQSSESLEASYPHWRDAEWDGTTGYGARGEAGWAWLVNLDHVYFVNDCLDIGATQIEPHGHGWPITALISNWSWTCR